jgi:ferredoxin
MAQLKTNSRTMEVTDGASLTDALIELGVPFGCESGICATCIIDVAEGAENLSKITDEEVSMELEPNQRLGCQCKIKKGFVRIDWE